MSFALGSEPNSALGSALGSSATGSCSIICDRLVIDCQRREPARPVQMLDLFRRKISSRSDRADVDSDDAAGRSVRAIAPLRRRHQPKQTSDQRRGIFTSGGLQKTGDPVAAEAVAANPRGTFGDARFDVGRQPISRALAPANVSRRPRSSLRERPIWIWWTFRLLLLQRFGFLLHGRNHLFWLAKRFACSQ